MEKKKLVVVGNKMISSDLSSKIDSFDFVFRLNRMNNYGLSGKKIDMLAVDPHIEFFKLVKNENFDKFHNAKQILLNSFFATPKACIKLMQKNIFYPLQIAAAIKINFQQYRQKLVERFLGHPDKTINFTNFFISVCYCLDNFNDEYNIHIACVDIENRGNMMKTNDIWMQNHASAGIIEEKMLKQFIDEHTITVL